MVQGLASGSVGSWHEVPRTSLAPSSAWLRLLRGRRLWFKVSPPARSARGMRSPGPHSVSAPLRSLQNRRPPDVLQPIFRKASVVAGQAPMVQGLASGSVGSWHEVPRTSLAPSSARLRLLRGRRPMGPRSPLRFGRRRADIPRMSCGLRSGRCRTDVPRTSCNPSSALKWGKLNYTDFVQNCILDQKERTSL